MMRKLLNEKLFLILVFLLAFFLRTVSLELSPPGFNADEAALGYNAFSLLKTGKDEWGESFPIVFKSFSDYKPGVYVYLAIPFVAALGLNELSVRLPSILLGSLAVVFIYLLAKELFASKFVSVATAFLLVFSPWHLHYSRGAWETNIATFFMLLGVWAFVKALKDSRFWFVTVLSFILSMYAYQSTRVVVPALGILLVIVYWKEIFGHRFSRFKDKKFLLAIFMGILLTIPLVLLIFSNKGTARFQGISIFTDTGPTAKIQQERGEHSNPSELTAKIYHNKFTAYTLNFFEHYFDHYTSNFLFITGDPLGRNKIPEMGQLFLFEMVTLIFGLYFLIRNRFKFWAVPIVWLMLAPLAAALTYQTPHALRAENMVVPLVLVSGLGLGLLIQKIMQFKKIVYIPGFFIAFLIISFFIARFFHQYFVHLPKQYALEWEYGFSQMVPYVFANKDSYDKVVITDRYDQAYILMLFYSQYDPIKYQQTAKPAGVDKFGFSTITSFDKFEFRPIGKEEVHKGSGTLYVGTTDEIPEDVKPLKVINFPNGEPAFKIVGLK